MATYNLPGGKSYDDKTGMTTSPGTSSNSGTQASYSISQRGDAAPTKNFTPGVYYGKQVNTPEEFMAQDNPQTREGGLGNVSVPSASQTGMATSGTPQQIQQPNQPVSTSPQIGSPSYQNSPVVSNTQNSTNPIGQSPVGQSSPDLGQKYVGGFQQTQNAGTKNASTSSTGRALVSDTTSNYQAPQQPYQPSPAFMQAGDPIMQSFIQSALTYQQDVVDTGYTAKALQAQFSNAVQGVDLEASNIQNIMNGTRDDIRAELGKAGAFTTESQVEGLVTTRNRDLLKQYNNLELQKQTMQNQMSLQVGLAQADHQYAVDKYNNVLQTANLYKGIYQNTTDQVDKLVQNVGYSGVAAAYNNDPYALSLVEQHLNMPQGTLSNPQALNQLETYRQQSLAMSGQRLGMQQERLNIYVNNNTPSPAATNAQLEAYKATGIVPSLGNTAQTKAFWNAVSQDPTVIGDASTNKSLRTAGTSALKNQTTQYEATKTSIGTVDKQLNLLSSYINGDPTKGLQAVDRSGVPLINRYKNFIAGTYSGDKDVTALNNIIQTASTEFAKILGGSSASIAGTPVSTQHDASNLLNSSMNTGQLNTVINLMKQEGQFRLSSQKETIDSINNGLRLIGSSQSSPQIMTGPDGKKYNVPADQVESFKQAGGY